MKIGIKRKLVLSLVITILIVMIIFFVILDWFLKDFSINEAEGITNRILILCVLIFLTLTITIYILSDRIVKPIKKYGCLPRCNTPLGPGIENGGSL